MSVKFKLKFNYFQSWKCIWIWRLQNETILPRSLSEDRQLFSGVFNMFGIPRARKHEQWCYRTIMDSDSHCYRFSDSKLMWWMLCLLLCCHDDVIKWNHLPRYWPFVRGIHRSPVNSLHKGQWRGALMFSLIWNGWVNNHEAGDLRRHSAHYDATVMAKTFLPWCHWRDVSRHFDFFKASLHNSNGNHLPPGQENLILF